MLRIFCILLIGVFVVYPQSVYAQRGGPQGPTPVIAAPVKTQNFADKVEALGTTKANETVMITADTSEKIAAIHFEDGQMVKQGDLLVTLDKGQEEAELRAAQALAGQTRSSYNRAKELSGKSALPKAAIQDRLSELRQTQAAVEASKARLNNYEIVAPFDGILGLREVSVGTLVQPGDMITTIDDLSQIKVDFDVPSVFLSALRPGLPVTGTIEAFGDREFRGEVRTVNTQVDPVTRTVRVRAILPNEDNLLRPGLLMSITLSKDPRRALLVPEEAVIKRGDKNFVFLVANEEGKTFAKQTEIQIGTRQPGLIEVLSGLNEGDQVIGHGTVKISDGAEIQVTAVESEDAPLDELLKQDQSPTSQAEGESE